MCVTPHVDEHAFEGICQKLVTSINPQESSDGAITKCDTEVGKAIDRDVKSVLGKLMQKVRETETYKQRSTNTFDGWVQLLTADLTDANNMPTPTASLTLIGGAGMMELIEQLKVLAKRNKMSRFVYPWTFGLFTHKNQSNVVMLLNTEKCADIRDRAGKLGMHWSPHLDLLFRVSASVNKCFLPVTHMQVDLGLLSRFGPQVGQLKQGLYALRDCHVRAAKAWIAAVKVMTTSKSYQQAKELWYFFFCCSCFVGCFITFKMFFNLTVPIWTVWNWAITKPRTLQMASFT